MALITCKECGKEFSDKAGACPNCGCPTELITNVGDDLKVAEPTQQESGQMYQQPLSTSIPQQKKESVLGIVGLIIGLIFCIPIFPVIGIILCIIAIRDKKHKSICGKIGLVLSILTLILGAYIFGSDTDSSDKTSNATVSTVQSSAPSAESTVQPTTAPTEKPTPTPEPVVVESKEDFMASCVDADYKTLARYPDDNIGARIKLTVKITQIMQGGWLDNGTYYRVYTDSDGYGLYLSDEYFMYDTRVDDDTKLLQDDIIQVYAEFAGMETVTRALTNTKEEVPAFKAFYIDILE